MARGPHWAPAERVKVGPPFPRSVGGAPGLCRRRRRRRQMHDPRCPPATGGGAAPSPSRKAGTRRAHPHSAHESGAEKLPPPPRRRRLPPGSLPDSPAGEGSRHSGLGPPPGARRQRRGRAAGRDGPGSVAGRAPSHSLAGPPRGRIAFKTFPSPPPGRTGGGRGAGRAPPSCAPGAGPPPLSLSGPPTQPQLSPSLSRLLPGAPNAAQLPPPGLGLWKQPQILSEGSSCGRQDRSRGPNPPSHPQTLLGKVLPLQEEKPRRPWAGTRDKGHGGWEARRLTQYILLLCTLPWKGMGLGILGSCQWAWVSWFPAKHQPTLPPVLPQCLLQPQEVPPFILPNPPLLSLKTLPRVQVGPRIKVPSPLWPPSIPAPHLPRGSGKLPSSWSIPGIESLPGSLPPSLPASVPPHPPPTSPPPRETRLHCSPGRGPALGLGLVPRWGARNKTKQRRGGVPSAAKTASLSMLACHFALYKMGQEPMAARPPLPPPPQRVGFWSQRTLRQPVWALLWGSVF